VVWEKEGEGTKRGGERCGKQKKTAVFITPSYKVERQY
jgi:hypothetical protein